MTRRDDPIPPDRSTPARVVVRTPNWLGDAVLALPAMAALRAHFASAHLTIAATGAVAALFREETDVRPDAVLSLPVSRRAAVRELRAGRFDMGVLLPNSFESAWWFKRAGIAGRWGASNLLRAWLLTRRSRPNGPRGVIHQAEFYRALVRGFGVPCGDEAPRLAPAAASRARARDLFDASRVAPDARVIGLAPGAAYGQAKQWPPNRVAELAARLVRDRDATCVIVGAGHDRDASRAIESWLRAHAPDASARVVDLVGKTDLGALAGVIERCRVFVSNDSGAMHVAAALGRPVVAIFGPTDERATRPIGVHDVITHQVFCRPCHLRDCPIDHRCMTRIGVDTVFGAVSRHLAFAR